MVGMFLVVDVVALAAVVYQKRHANILTDLADLGDFLSAQFKC
jgi:hypothetical protein